MDPPVFVAYRYSFIFIIKNHEKMSKDTKVFCFMMALMMGDLVELILEFEIIRERPYEP